MSYTELRAAERDAIKARDAIDNCFSPEWKAAHAIARDLGLRASAMMVHLAKTDRQGTWAGPAEKELMLKGWM